MSNEFIERLELFDLFPYGYSGRGMYGRRCVGVNVESLGELLDAIFMLGVEYGENDDQYLEVQRVLKDTCMDNMGLGWVFYWPDAEWPEERDES